MGFKRHNTLKCGFCKRKQPTGGTKKSGSWEGDGWKLEQLKPGHWVQICPVCVRRRNASAAKPV